MFILQSLADAWQLGSNFDEKALAALSDRMHTVTEVAIKGPHGGAIDSCFHHCLQWGNIRLGGETNSAAFRRWYESSIKAWRARGSEQELPPAAAWPVLQAARPWCKDCCEGQTEARAVHQNLTRW